MSPQDLTDRRNRALALWDVVALETWLIGRDAAYTQVQATAPDLCLWCNGSGLGPEYEWAHGHGWDCPCCDGTGVPIAGRTPHYAEGGTL